MKIYNLTEQIGEYFFKRGQALSFNAELSYECPGAPKVIAFSVPMAHLSRKHSVPVHSGEKQGGGRSWFDMAISQTQTPLAAPISF